MNLDIFRVYDIRGVLDVDFESKGFYRIACAYTECFRPKTVAVRHDVRESSPELWRQVALGFQDSGVDVLNLGRISTDMLYFAVEHYRTDGGVVNCSLRRRCKSVRNLKASAAAEKRNFDGKLKNLLKKHEFEIISLGFSIFCHIMHVFCQKLWSLKRETIRRFEL